MLTPAEFGAVEYLLCSEHAGVFVRSIFKVSVSIGVRVDTLVGFCRWLDGNPFYLVANNSEFFRAAAKDSYLHFGC